MGTRRCPWLSRRDGQGQGLYLQAKEPLVGSSCPFGHSNFCLFSGTFVFFFLRRRVGGWILHFHSLPIEQPGYKRGCRWLPPPRSFIQSQHTAPKFQVPWKVAVAVAGLDCGRRIPGPRHSSTIGPAAAGSSAGGWFCSPAASAGSDLLRQGGTAGISYCLSLTASSTLGASCCLPRKSSSHVWPSTSSRRLAVDTAAPSD